MAGIFSSPKTSQAQQPAAAAGISIQKSCYGGVIPVVIGDGKAAPTLIDYGNFRSTTTSSGGNGGAGGKSGGGGSGGGTSTTTYSAMFGMGLCQGPIVGVGTVWSAKVSTTAEALGLTVFTGEPTQTPFGWSTSQNILQETHTIPTTAPYNVTVDWPGAPVTDYGVVDADTGTPFLTSDDGSGSPLYSADAGTYAFSETEAGVDVTIKYTSANQQPPSRGLVYPYLAYAAAANFDLGTSPSSPNNNFQIFGFYSGTDPAGSPAADPSLFANGILTDQRWGIGTLFPSWGVGDQSWYQAYTLASGLVIGAVYDQQQTVAQALSDLATYTNADIAILDTVQFLPHCDTAITANGITYTPPEATFEFTDDDWLLTNAAATATGSAAADPLVLNRARPDTIINQVTLEYLNRANQYAPETVVARDVASIRRYGLKEQKSQQAHIFTGAVAAHTAAQLQLQRAAASANTWQGTVAEYALGARIGRRGWISSAVQGVPRTYVKITNIAEQADFSLAFTFEEIHEGAGLAAQHTLPNAHGSAPNYNVDPGDSAPPIIFEPPYALAGDLEVWIASYGGVNWGGCQVWISTDQGANYARAGTITAGARMGVLAAELPAGTDPDTTDTLAVDISASRGVMISGTQGDADGLVTLCWIEGELLAYETATLTGAGHYNLTYLRRGAYGTSIASHASGARFLRVDPAILKLSYSRDHVGDTLYVKLVSFNQFAGAVQDLAEVTATQYRLGGAPPLPAPTDLTLQAGNAQTLIARDGTLVDRILATWIDPAPATLFSEIVTRYRQPSDSTWQQGVPVPAGVQQAWLSPVVDGATYDVEIATTDSAGNTSAWVSSAVIVTGQSGFTVSPVSGLELVGRGNDTTFTGETATFDWRWTSTTGSFELGDAPFGADTGWSDPYVRGFAVCVYDAVSGIKIRSEPMQTGTRYSYSLDANLADSVLYPPSNGDLARRSFTIGVAVVDLYGRPQNEQRISVSNPAPAMPTAIQASAAFNTIFLSFKPDSASDVAGNIVWASTTSGTEPVPGDATQVYDGPGTMVTIPAIAGTTYYLHCTTYDSFGKTGLNVSSELSCTPVTIQAIDIAENAIDSGHLATALAAQIDSSTTGLASLTETVSGITSTVGGNTTSIEEMLSTIDGTYTLKVDVNGYVAGFGLTNSGTTSEFVVRADAFGIINPTGGPGQTPVTPFVVSGGQVYIDGAQIKTASIGSAAIGSLTADKLTAGTVTANNILLGGPLFALNAGNQQLVVSDSIHNRVVLGALGGGQYGIAIYDGSGNTIFGSGGFASGAVPSSAVNGLGAFASLGQITSANAGTYIANAAVNTLQIAGQAVTIPTSVANGSTVTLSTTAATIITKVLTTSGAPLSVTFGFRYQVYDAPNNASLAGTQNTVTANIYRGSTLIGGPIVLMNPYPTMYGINLGTGVADFGYLIDQLLVTSIVDNSAPAPGSYTYTIQITATYGGTATASWCNFLETKR